MGEDSLIWDALIIGSLLTLAVLAVALFLDMRDRS